MLFLVAALVSSIATPAEQIRPPIRIPDLERKISDGINVERQANNVTPLAFDEGLSRIARAHSEDMVNRNFFSHVNADGEHPRDRLRRGGYNCPKISGENIFQNNLYSRITTRGNQKVYDWNSAGEIAGTTIHGWMESAGHRQNILQKSYLRTGVGIAISQAGQVFITQVFCG